MRRRRGALPAGLGRRLHVLPRLGSLEGVDEGVDAAGGAAADGGHTADGNRAVGEQQAQGGDGAASKRQQAAVANRTLYQAGEDLGVKALLDKHYRWPQTIRVCSKKAVLLELPQKDFEEMLQADLGFKQSAGEMIKNVNAAREPRSLQLVWPFFGAPAKSCLLYTSPSPRDS